MSSDVSLLSVSGSACSIPCESNQLIYPRISQSASFEQDGKLAASCPLDCRAKLWWDWCLFLECGAGLLGSDRDLRYALSLNISHMIPSWSLPVLSAILRIPKWRAKNGKSKKELRTGGADWHLSGREKPRNFTGLGVNTLAMTGEPLPAVWPCSSSFTSASFQLLQTQSGSWCNSDYTRGISGIRPGYSFPDLLAVAFRGFTGIQALLPEQVRGLSINAEFWSRQKNRKKIGEKTKREQSCPSSIFLCR